MLAKRIDELPAGQTWIFEPKWDGFRALIFRDQDEILIQSLDAKSLNRYFPEFLESLKAQLPARGALKGEIVVAKNDGLDFEFAQAARSSGAAFDTAWPDSRPRIGGFEH
jgi:ATP-dependent DNA ligase